MMAGDGPHNVSMLNNGSVRVNMQNVDSPLQIFVRAKKKINDIFVEIDDYVKDAVTFMHGEPYNNRHISWRTMIIMKDDRDILEYRNLINN